VSDIADRFQKTCAIAVASTPYALMTRWMIVVAATLTLSSLVYASVDCSSLEHWSSDKRYKKGAQVWYLAAGGNDGKAFKCVVETCLGSGEHEPSQGSDWQSMGLCSNRPKGE
jgi:hypothetical protein